MRQLFFCLGVLCINIKIGHVVLRFYVAQFIDEGKNSILNLLFPVSVNSLKPLKAVSFLKIHVWVNNSIVEVASLLILLPIC